MKKKEITESTFRKIPSLKFLYEVNPYGVVRNVKSKKILKGSYDKDGYIRIGTRINNKPINRSTHRLVAEVFVPNPNNYPVINHINEIKDDNHYKNLEWVTVAYNNSYGSRPSQVSESHSSKYGDILIVSTGKTFKSSMEAAEYIFENKNLKTSKVRTVASNIRNGITNGQYYYGSKWKRLEITNPID